MALHKPARETLEELSGRGPARVRLRAMLEYRARGKKVERQIGRSIALECRTAAAVHYARARLEQLARELDGARAPALGGARKHR